MSFAYLLIEDLDQFVTFDVVRSVTTNEGATVTENPVEIGASVADHIRPDLVTCQLVAFATDTPIRPTPGAGGLRGEVTELEPNFPVWEYPDEFTPGSGFRLAGEALGAAADAIGSALGFGGGPPNKISVLAFPLPFNRPLEIETVLRQARDGGLLCTVVTDTRQFASMAIVNISASKTTFGGKDFDVSLREVRLASTELVEVTPVPAELRGVPGSAQGKQAGKLPDPFTTQSSKSTAAELIDLAKGLIP